jgi:tight adherence protein B
MAVAATVAVAAAGTALVTPAAAAEAPIPATISSVRTGAGTLSGVLTVRSGASAPVQAGVKATVGGKDVPVSVTPVPQGKRATMLVVDTSGSMGEAGMITVRSAVGAFLRDAPKDVAVGLVSFAGTAGIDVPPTADRARIQRAVNGLRSRGETTLYDAVTIAASALSGYTDRSIILLSDGGDTASTKASKASATKALTAAGVRAEVIGFKTGESDNSVLAGFARAGGGSVAAAGNADAVRTAFEAAAKALDAQVTFSIQTGSISGTQPVVITGTVNGKPFKATTSVDVAAGAAPAPSTPSAPATPAAQPDATFVPVKVQLPMSVYIGAGAILLGLVAGAALLLAPSASSASNRRAQTIERYVTPSAVAEVKVVKASPSALSAQLVNIGDRVMDGRESTGKTMALMERADLPLRAGEWWVLRIISLVAGVAGALIFFSEGVASTIFATFLGVVGGFFVPSVVLRFLASRRTKKFEAQLPDVLTLVASSLSTGFSLPQALDAVAKDAAQPAAKEFSRALAETRIGSDISDALERMSARMQSENMRWTTMAIRIQREVGGNLADTLRTTAKTLREREELGRHVKALSAEGKLSAYILIALPIGIFLYEYQVNHSYIELLWTRTLGWVMMAGGIISLTVGIFWMRKTVQVKV